MWQLYWGNNLFQFKKIGIKKRENIFLPIQKDWDTIYKYFIPIICRILQHFINNYLMK
jgi:hypothetical protein